jgi:hypothetical protein
MFFAYSLMRLDSKSPHFISSHLISSHFISSHLISTYSIVALRNFILDVKKVTETFSGVSKNVRFSGLAGISEFPSLLRGGRQTQKAQSSADPRKVKEVKQCLSEVCSLRWRCVFTGLTGLTGITGLTGLFAGAIPRSHSPRTPAHSVFESLSMLGFRNIVSFFLPSRQTGWLLAGFDAQRRGGGMREEIVCDYLD